MVCFSTGVLQFMNWAAAYDIIYMLGVWFFMFMLVGGRHQITVGVAQHEYNKLESWGNLKCIPAATKVLVRIKIRHQYTTACLKIKNNSGYCVINVRRDLLWIQCSDTEAQKYQFIPVWSCKS